jgi:sulfur relay (sulfurtransferase) DsrC/TusE family protein
MRRTTPKPRQNESTKKIVAKTMQQKISTLHWQSLQFLKDFVAQTDNAHH